jgi:hypothetical protein
MLQLNTCVSSKLLFYKFFKKELFRNIEKSLNTPIINNAGIPLKIQKKNLVYLH